MNPVLKWVGTKKNILDEINVLIPKKEKYFEPFVGGGSVFLNLPKNSFKFIWISDINKNLITTYEIIRDRPNDLINEIEKLTNNYNRKNFRTQKGIYLRTRDAFNKSNDDLEIASKLCFLNKICFGGLYRTNQFGEFNTAFLRKLEINFDYDNIIEVSKFLQGIDIKCCDYKNILKYVDKNSFVFLDPPYYETFNQYYKNSFDGNNISEMYDFCCYLDNNDISFILCNSDNLNVIEMFKKRFDIKIVDVENTIKQKRKDILIYNG